MERVARGAPVRMSFLCSAAARTQQHEQWEARAKYSRSTRADTRNTVCASTCERTIVRSTRDDDRFDRRRKGFRLNGDHSLGHRSDGTENIDRSHARISGHAQNLTRNQSSLTHNQPPFTASLSRRWYVWYVRRVANYVCQALGPVCIYCLCVILTEMAQSVLSHSVRACEVYSATHHCTMQWAT